VTHDPVQTVVAELDALGFDPRPTGPDSWASRCPAHNGSRPNLSIRRGDDGKVLLNCLHAPKCDHKAIVAALGMAERDLFPYRDGRADRRSTPRSPGGASRPRGTTEPKPKQPKRSYSSPDDAIAWAVAKWGKPTGRWPYHGGDGRELMRVYRFDPPGRSKEYLPIHATGNGSWAVGDPDGPLPLYRLTELADAPLVIVCEGEKAADAARRISFAATTASHGAQSPHKTDWTPLAGKTVILCPDHDEPGEAYTAAVVGLLAALSPRPTVKVLRLPSIWRGDEPPTDLDDWLRRGVPDTWEPGQ
jgi:hypothetical protein